MKSKNIYSLPFNKKDLIMACSNPGVHFANFKHAIDFIFPEGTKILAPRDGVVIDVKVDSKEGGIDLKYLNIKYTNYITLGHDNNEFTQYLHLKHNGALVKSGDKVKRGQPIALSGNTGLSTLPPLHFQVFEYNNTKVGSETLEVRFRGKIDIYRKKGRLPKKLEKIMSEFSKGLR